MFRTVLYKDGAMITCTNCRLFAISASIGTEVWTCRGCGTQYTIVEGKLIKGPEKGFDEA